MPHLVFQHKVSIIASLALDDKPIIHREYVLIQILELLPGVALTVGAYRILIASSLRLLVYRRLDAAFTVDFHTKTASYRLEGDVVVD